MIKIFNVYKTSNSNCTKEALSLVIVFTSVKLMLITLKDIDSFPADLKFLGPQPEDSFKRCSSLNANTFSLG